MFGIRRFVTTADGSKVFNELFRVCFFLLFNKILNRLNKVDYKPDRIGIQTFELGRSMINTCQSWHYTWPMTSKILSGKTQSGAEVWCLLYVFALASMYGITNLFRVFQINQICNIWNIKVCTIILIFICIFKKWK